MKNTTLILLIVLCLIGVANLAKPFIFDQDLKEAKQSLVDAQSQVEVANKLNIEAKREMQILIMTLDKYEVRNEKLRLEIDSIVLVKRAKDSKGWKDQKSIRKKQEEIRSRLKYLRQKDKAFD